MTEFLRGRYELLDVLGRGGEGRVVKALDHQHDRVVALKIRTVRGDEDRDELLAEARLLLDLPSHPSLPLVREDFFEGDSYVIAMDFVDGIDLARLVAERGEPGLAPSSVLSYLADAADALTHLHSQHPCITHGDVKPGNLILTRGGRVKLVDFGMSSIATTRRRRAGTPGFRAPELAGGSPPSRATDVYSLAATAFALFTGAPPSGTLPTWDGLDDDQARELEAALRRGLANDPARRPATPGELVERLAGGWATSLPTGVMTFCLSDIEGSTALWDEQPEAMASALVRHDELIAHTVETRGGRFLKSMGEGDSTVSVFGSAVNAVAAAVAICDAIATEPWPDGLTFQLRFGLHTGEAERRGTDYFGPTLNLAARLRAQADGGQIFCSETTGELVESHLPTGYRLVDLGPHRLKGIATPERVFAVAGAGVTAPFSSTECPYRGLLSFESDDRSLFFGREEVVESMTRRLRAGGLLALVGASGSGKSSVLRAGIVAACRAGEISQFSSAVVHTPGVDCTPPPCAEADSIVVVDQFEELFTLCNDGARRDAYIDALMAQPGGVIIGVRADYYGHLTAHPALAQAVTENQVLLGAMNAGDLRRAIIEPARLAGLKIENGLVEVIERDIAGAPGALPLLSHALRATWEQRDGRTLTLEGYRETGGVESAIARSADHIVDETPSDQHAALRRLFLRLTEIGEGAEVARRRVQIEDLVPEGGSPAETEAVLAQLADARLVTLDDGTAEVAHEALIREWPRLRTWLDEDRAGLRLHRLLSDAAQLWETGGHEHTDLYRGTRLDAAREWSESNVGALNSRERAFLDASIALHDAETAELVARAAHQQRTNRRLRVFLTAAVIALVLALVGGGIAVRQTKAARRETHEADIQRLVGQSGAFLDSKRDLGMLLAVEANRLSDRTDTRGALQSALVQDPSFLGYIHVGSANSQAVVFSHDNRRLLVGQDDGSITAIDVATRKPVGPVIHAFTQPVSEMRMTPDGKSVVAYGGDPPKVERFDVATGRRLNDYTPKAYVFAFDLSPDGTQVALGTYVPPPGQSQVLVSDTRSGRLVRTLTGDPSPQTATNNNGPNRAVPAYSSTGLLAISTAAQTISLYDAKTFARVGTLGGVQGVVGGYLSFSADGSHLVSADRRTTGIMLWDVNARRPSWPQRIEADIFDIAATSTNDVLYTNESGVVVRVSGATGQPQGIPISLQGGSICSLALSPDGTKLGLASCNDSLAGLVSLDGSSTIAPIAARERLGGYSSDGSMLWTYGSNSITIRDAHTFAPRYRVPFTAPAAFDPADPRYMLVMDGQGRGGRYDYRAHRFASPPVPIPRADGITAISVDPATGHVAMGYDDGGVIVFEAGGAVVAPRGIKIVDTSPGNQINGLAFSPDGAHLAVSAEDEFTTVFDTRTGHPTGPRIARAASAQFSPNGKLLVTAAFDGAFVFHDSRTLAPVGASMTGSRSSQPGLTFSRDGSLLVATDVNSGARLFDVRSRQQIGSAIAIAPDSMNALRPDAKALALETAPHGTDVTQIWSLDIGAWRSAACLEAGRNLTRAEFSTYLKGPYHATCPQWPAPN